uniref:PEP5/VPS11 N-terminal domain-containing protein n=1 Tax=Romanomermis culicivorax TaxID=13658 RepID=A0A915HN98_ROMCU
MNILISRRFLASLAGRQKPVYNVERGGHYYKKKFKLRTKNDHVLAFCQMSKNFDDVSCLHFSKYDGGYVNPRKSDKPSWDQLQNVLLRLSDSLPKFGLQKLDYTVFDDEVELIDRVFHRHMRGLQNYMYYAGATAVVLRTIHPVFYTQVLNLTPIVEDSTIRGRCRTYRMNILDMILNVVFRFKWKYDDLRKEAAFTDTIHIFHVDGHGMIYRHVIDRVLPDDEKTFNQKSKKIVTKMSKSNFVQDLQVQFFVDGRDSIFVAESDATVHQILNARQFETRFFRAYKILLYQMDYVQEKNLLVAVGEDLPGVNPLLKIWNLNQLDKNDVPFCLRCSRISPGNRVAKVTALTATVSLIAVGFEDSSVLIFRGDISKDKQNKHFTLRDGLTCTEDGAVVALASAPDGILYVGTSHVILIYSIHSKEKDFKLLNTFKENIFARCWALADKDLWHQFVVAKREGVYFYQPDLKAAAHLFDGEKILIKTSKNHLLVIFRDVNTVE